MHRSLTIFAAFTLLMACSKSGESKEEKAPETRAQPSGDAPAPSAEPTPRPEKAPAVETYPKKPAPSVHGEAQHLARLGEDSAVIHDVAVLGEYAYVNDAGGMIYRIKIDGGEPEVVHDSGGGSGVHGSSPTRIGDEIYFLTSDDGESKTLYKVVDGKPERIRSGPEVLYLAGDGTDLFAAVYNKDDLYRMGPDGFKPFVKTPDPGFPRIVGDHIYWTSYNRGGVHRVLLSGKKKQRLASNRKTLGLAVIGDTVYYGTESDGGVHAVPTSGGKSKLLVDGFNNHDSFIADEGGVYFWTWGKPSAVLRLDATTNTVESLIYGLDPPRGLTIQDGWLYVVGGLDLFRVKTDARMPWPVVAD